MRILSALLLLCCGALLSTTGAQTKPQPYDYAKARASLHDYLADKHADVGDDFKQAKIYAPARKQYDRARELVPDHTKAMKGLGFEKRKGKWEPDKPLPDKEELQGEQMIEAQKKPEKARIEAYNRCAERCRKSMEDAAKAGDARAQRIFASYLIYYASHDAEAHKVRGHVQDGGDWVPQFALDWRREGAAIYAAASEGEAMTGEDEQAKLIDTKFLRRRSEYLVARTSFDEARAKAVHKGAEGNMKRTMELLGLKDSPFGKGRQYTVTHVTSPQYEAALTKILKLEGDKLEFNKRTQGTGMPQPWGFLTRASGKGGADDMIGNTIALMLLGQARGHEPDTAHWLKTGFGYLVTSQVLGTVSTVRYTMGESGATAANRNFMPEFTKKSGSPEFLREVALYDVNFGRDIALEKLVQLEVNDVDLGAAAKSFALFEFFFEQHKDKTVKWLLTRAPKKEDRVKDIETAFGKPVAELETEWREWVLARY